MTTISVSDLTHPDLQIYVGLSENQLRHIFEPDFGLFIAESPNVIKRALDDGYEPYSVLVEDKELKGEVLALIETMGPIPVYTASYEVLIQLTGFALTRGMLCAMRRRAFSEPSLLLKHCRRIAVLEDVVNPTNIGAIFRSAAALNMDAILLTHACSDPLYRRAARVSMGTVFQIPWTYLPKNETDYVSFLQKEGFQTVAFALTDQSISIDDERLSSADKLAIILGTEGDGLRQGTIDACDYTVKIPMSHNVDSLNVAAASAVAFWQLGK